MRPSDAAATLDATLSAVRGSSEVDAGRVGVWFFSGGGPLAYPLLAAGHDAAVLRALAEVSGHLTRTPVLQG